MASKLAMAAAVALMTLPSLAYAASTSPRQRGRWRPARASGPLTPLGLLLGTGPVLAKIDGHESGLASFVDGNRACTPMAATKALLSLLDNVATSQISHEGGGLSEFEGRGRERLAVHDAARAISGVVRIGAAGGARALSAKRGVSTLRQS